MVDFNQLKEKAQGFLGEHADQIKTGVDKVGGFVGDRIGHDKVDPIESKIGGFLDGLAAEQQVAPPAAQEPPPAPPVPPVVPPAS